ncbi:hypothetical protein BN1086_04878 [Citrobacter koseri]|uniref:Uncharacterized protein n=1 Tax=Citrobacter koseri TaxID=545 RepID=A0A078LMQ6_CITKO|nr:hypothetical protein BN1086_04878 [Citrobacter koseri]
METLENSERHWPARRKHMFFQIFMAQHICRDAVEIHWANGNIQVIRPVRGSSINGEKKYVLPDFIVTARAPDGKTARVVIETMGYEDSDYCARKSRQHTGMKQIGVLHTDPPKWLDNDHPPFEKHMYGVFMHLRY